MTDANDATFISVEITQHDYLVVWAAIQETGKRNSIEPLKMASILKEISQNILTGLGATELTQGPLRPKNSSEVN